MPLSDSQRNRPHRQCATGNVLSLTALERSFFDPARADERLEWWANGVAERALSSAPRGPRLVQAFLERFKAHRWSYQGRAAWDADAAATWDRLWSGLRAAPSELLSAAWEVAALHAPSRLDGLMALGADPHLPFKSSASSPPQSAWNAVLKSCAVKEGAAEIALSALLERWWPQQWGENQKEMALAIVCPTPTIPEKSLTLIWRERFRDRLLAEGVQPWRNDENYQEISRFQTRPLNFNSAMSRWFKELSLTSDVEVSPAFARWGLILIQGVSPDLAVRPLLVKEWANLSCLDDSAPLVNALIERGQVPWGRASTDGHDVAFAFLGDFCDSRAIA